MSRLGLTVLIAFSGFVQISAQNTRCGFTAYEQALRQHSPEYAAFLQRKGSHPPVSAKQQGTIVIPVIVHVVWNTQAERISRQQVRSQIDILNEDFNRQNTDTSKTPTVFKPVAGSADVQFCLAQRGPQGMSTNGIQYYRTPKTTFSFLDDDVKSVQTDGADAWPADQYLNIWVCNLNNGSVAGYATPPGAPASLDGVVLDYRFTGIGGTALPPGDRGRTGTHEVGHWMDLRHIWGDGGCGVDDGIADTPPQGNSYQGCPSFPQNACGSSNPGAMFMNYMDYTADVCMNLFTQGQVTKMRTVFEPGGARARFMGALGCFTVSNDPKPVAQAQLYAHEGGLAIKGQIDIGNAPLSVRIYSSIGKQIYHATLTSVLPQLDLQIDTEGWPTGVYWVVLEGVGTDFRYSKRILHRH